MSLNFRMVSVGLFLLGTVFGCILAFLFNRIRSWLSIRVLPAQYLHELPVRRRYVSDSVKEAVRGK